MKPVVHAIAGTTAMLAIATFWVSTLVSELWLDAAAIAAVKHSIVVYGLVVLVLAMAATGGSGFALVKARTGRLLALKKRRMPLIVLNGVVVMIPAAIFLNHQAGVGAFDGLFYTVQVIELAGGVVQMALMGLNFRDGLALAARRRSPPSDTGTQTLSDK